MKEMIEKQITVLLPNHKEKEFDKIIDDCKKSLGLPADKPFIGFLCTRGSIFPRDKVKEPELTERQKLIKRLKQLSR